MRSVIFFGALCLLSGCAITSTEKRSALIGGGGAAGALLGREIGHGSPGATVAGAAAGALTTGLVLGKDPVVQQEGFDQGYVQGQSDAIKRHYEMRMRAHRAKSDAEEGETVWYVVPGPTETNDGRRLEPHTVAIPVKE